MYKAVCHISNVTVFRCYCTMSLSYFFMRTEVKAHEHYLLLAGPYLPTKLLDFLNKKEELFLLRKKYKISVLFKQESNTVY